VSDHFPHVREPSSGEPDICIYCREEWVDLLTLYERDECSVRLRAEVERLRADLDALARAVGQAVVASSLAAGETLADPIPHIIVATVTRLRAEALGQRAEASYLRACVPPTHPTDYGHEVWTETVRDAVDAERAAVVAWLREHTNSEDACMFASWIERGEHRRKETR
jgi:hypothetical protein